MGSFPMQDRDELGYCHGRLLRVYNHQGTITFGQGAYHSYQVGQMLPSNTIWAAVMIHSPALISSNVKTLEILYRHSRSHESSG
jgi:hypothetical protein